MIWLGLILCNVIWALNPIAGKRLIAELGPVHAAWLRYCSSFFAYLLIGRLLRDAYFRKSERLFMAWTGFPDAWIVGWIGLTAFFISPLTQMAGLSATTAASN